MRYLKITIPTILASSCFSTIFFYFWYKNGSFISLSGEGKRVLRFYRPMKHVPLQAYKNDDEDSSEFTEYDQPYGKVLIHL